ncbi:scopoletin glucosyltransferase-like [Pistacia vera]|uniref:scopoletin glucosyltransferase-like n=1 Tax=Pistacia vera TaxID=55513 RepID=UPI001263DD28|nr:scopoletin glucosyltransferase-like [Pistacia vera]
MDSLSQPRQLHIFFLPQMADKIINPTTDMARIFAREGLKANIISTHLNAPFVSSKIEKDRQLGLEISVRLIKFPCLKAGLPEGCENLHFIVSPEMAINFKIAHILLRQPVEELLQECHPNCLVSDRFFPWATEVAGKLGIPR